MDRLSRIKNIIRWQQLYQERKMIVSTYEGLEKKLTNMQEDCETAQKNKNQLTEFSVSLAEKIKKEEDRLDFLINQMENMEKDRDNLKMARQIKSWEKDMDKYSQDKAMVEAQFYYDRSKMGDITQELETIEVNLSTYTVDMAELLTEIEKIKSETKTEREAIEKEMDEITSLFDTHFVEYFNRLLLKSNGIVMAIIEDDSCSGCNILLPTSYHGGNKVQDADDSALLQCPNCFRYLYYEEDI